MEGKVKHPDFGEFINPSIGFYLCRYNPLQSTNSKWELVEPLDDDAYLPSKGTFLFPEDIDSASEKIYEDLSDSMGESHSKAAYSKRLGAGYLVISREFSDYGLLSREQTTVSTQFPKKTLLGPTIVPALEQFTPRYEIVPTRYWISENYTFTFEGKLWRPSIDIVNANFDPPTGVSFTYFNPKARPFEKDFKEVRGGGYKYVGGL